MFIGHFAVGFAAKRAAPRASLGVLLAAPMLADLLWPIFLTAGWERVRIEPGNTAFTPLAFDSYPYSHSLLMLAVWGAAAAAAYWMRTRDRIAAAVIAAGVLSHWVLDAATHRPDMPLWPGVGPLIGLGLWNSVPGTVAVELLLFLPAVWLYLRTTREANIAGRWSFRIFLGVVALIYAGAAQGAPPPSLTALKVTALCAWLFPVWAYWLDRPAL